MELGTLFGDFVVMLIKTRGFAYFVETLVVVVLVQLLKKLCPSSKSTLREALTRAWLRRLFLLCRWWR